MFDCEKSAYTILLAIATLLPLLDSKYMCGMQSDGHQRGDMNTAQ
jgi:hypothetical protein